MYGSWEPNDILINSFFLVKINKKIYEKINVCVSQGS
jgi:hypothetical protein